MKKYFYEEYEWIDEAIQACNENQNWNIINIYPTGWRQEVRVVFYVQSDK